MTGGFELHDIEELDGAYSVEFWRANLFSRK